MNIEKWAIGILTVVIAVLLGIAIFSAESQDSVPIRGEGQSGKVESRVGAVGPGTGGREVDLKDARNWKYATKDVKKSQKKTKEQGRAIVLDDGGNQGAAVAMKTTTVRPNETFSHIANRVWGKASLYPLLVKANPKLNPRNLRKGQTVYIPNRDDGSVKNAAASETAKTTSIRTHTVASNETLSAISKRYYRTSGKWRQIYEANRDVLRSPDAVVAGQVLRIP